MKKIISTSTHLALSFLLIVGNLSVFSQNKVIWKGGAPGMVHEWNSSRNWSNYKVPDCFSDVFIPDVSSTSLAPPVIRQGVYEVNSLVVYSNATLTIEEDAKLVVYNPDNCVFQKYELIVKGTLLMLEDSDANASLIKGTALSAKKQ